LSFSGLKLNRLIARIDGATYLREMAKMQKDKKDENRL
jgi:hypothetical protein